VLQPTIKKKGDIMKLDELPFEVFERIVENVSFVDLPYFLQVSRSVHVLSLTAPKIGPLAHFTCRVFSKPRDIRCTSDSSVKAIWDTCTIE
jgi:hypothetical protein